MRSLMLGITVYAVTGCHSLWDSLELLFNCIMVAATSASMSVFQAEIRKKEQTGYAWEGVKEDHRKEELFQNPLANFCWGSLACLLTRLNLASREDGKHIFHSIHFFLGEKWPLLIKKDRMYIVHLAVPHLYDFIKSILKKYSLSWYRLNA